MSNNNNNDINTKQIDQKINFSDTSSSKLKIQHHNDETSINNEIKLIKPTVKKPPDILCNCPQKCDQRVPQEIRSSLYKEFCSLGDHIRQNSFLQSYIEMRSVYKRLWSQEERIGGRLQRRVSCKYKVPVEVPKLSMGAAVDLPHSSPKLITNSKGQATIIIGVTEECHTIEVCQKAFMNVYGITEKRIRLQREKLIARLREDNPDHYLSLGNAINDNNKKLPTTMMDLSKEQQQTCYDNLNLLPLHSDDDQLIVDTFFRNQLWKPEYIGIPTDRLQYLDIYYNNLTV